MKTLDLKVVAAFSPREFSEKSTELIRKMRRAGWQVKDFQFDTTALKDPDGENEIIGYSGVYFFESESND